MTECDGLTSIEFPDSLETIGVLAFAHCDSLEKISLPANATIELSAFSYCAKLTSAGPAGSGKAIEFPANITEIPAYCLSGTLVTEVVFPDGITKIGKGAINDCEELTITVPDTVEEIGDLAFMYVKQLNYKGSLEGAADWGAAHVN